MAAAAIPIHSTGLIVQVSPSDAEEHLGQRHVADGGVESGNV